MELVDIEEIRKIGKDFIKYCEDEDWGYSDGECTWIRVEQLLNKIEDIERIKLENK